MKIVTPNSDYLTSCHMLSKLKPRISFKMILKKTILIFSPKSVNCKSARGVLVVWSARAYFWLIRSNSLASCATTNGNNVTNSFIENTDLDSLTYDVNFTIYSTLEWYFPTYCVTKFPRNGTFCFITIEKWQLLLSKASRSMFNEWKATQDNKLAIS